MSAQMNHRSFLRSTLAYASLPLIGRFAIASPNGMNVDEDQRTAWYRAAKFGMFIHWGPYALASVEASWPIMEPDHWDTTEAEYRAAKGGPLYVHIFDWPIGSFTIADLLSKVLAARLLANNHPLRFQQTDKELSITLPPQAPDTNVSVVALRTL